MKRSVFVMISSAALLFPASNLPAQNAVFPVVPITVNLEMIPQLFRQVLDPSGNPWYSSIEAEVDATRNPAWYQIVVRERSSGKQIYYCNSQNTVNTWKSLGLEAYYVPIEVKSSPGSPVAYEFQFRDAAGQSIDWKFVVGSPDTNLWGISQFMPRPDDFGFVLVRGAQSFRAASGSVVGVADTPYPAVGISFYSTGVVIADIQPAEEQWSVTDTPQLRAGGKWTMRGSGGRDQALTVEQASGDSLVVDAFEPNLSNAAKTRMNLVKSGNQYALTSLTTTARDHAFRIEFDPELPLPVPMTQDKTAVKFTMDVAGLGKTNPADYRS